MTERAAQLKALLGLDQPLRALLGEVVEPPEAHLQVLLVIQLHLGGVLEARLVIQADPNRAVALRDLDRELGMAPGEIVDLPLVAARPILRPEVSVTPGAVCILHRRQDDLPLCSTWQLTQGVLPTCVS